MSVDMSIKRGRDYVCDSVAPSIRFGLVRLAMDLLGEGKLDHTENVLNGLLRNPVSETKEEIQFFDELTEVIYQSRSKEDFT